MIVDAKAFANALAMVLPATSQRLGMATSCVTLNQDSAGVRLTATNGELWISTVCGAEGNLEPVMVPAKRLTAMVRTMTGEVTLANVKGYRLQVTSGGSRIELAGIDPRECPPAPPEEGDLAPTGFDLVTAIRRLDYCAADFSDRPALAGMLWESTGNSVRLAASDSRRCALTDQPFEGPTVREMIGREVLDAIRATCNGYETVNVAFSERFIRIETRVTWLVARLTGFSFPKIEHVLPSHTLNARMPRAQLAEAVKRVNLVSGDDHKITLELTGERAIVRAIGVNVGEAVDEVALSATVQEPVEISMNGRYLLDALNAMDGDEITMRYGREVDPLDMESNGFRHVLMPMRTN